MTQNYPSLEEFLNLPTEEVAKLVKASGSKVVVFPINGTRRWFMLEYGNQEFEDPVAAYMDIAMQRHIELYKLFFDHGVDTLLTPVIGPEILATRDGYMQKIGAEGLARLVTHPAFLSFYEKYGVRVRFYGEYRKQLANTPYEHLSDLFEGIAKTTAQNDRFRLFFGAFADNLNATSIVAEIAVQYHREYGIVPEREKIVEMYYGEYVEKANIFIGFDRFAAFDYPLINWGEEDLYFMVAPSSYITNKQLREILYDHMYTRQALEVEYMSANNEKLNSVQEFYSQNQECTLGVGRLLNGTWIPNLQSGQAK
jgi:tuberculosinol/isotuberculosinol synthase